MTSTKPGSLSRPNIRATVGLRKSESTNSVRLPNWVIVIAKFAVTVLLPSPLVELVTIIVL